MKIIWTRKIFFLSLFFSLGIGNTYFSYATEGVSSEVRKDFWDRTGRRWFEASEKEKKIFLRSIKIREERKFGEEEEPVKVKRKVYVAGTYAGSGLAVRYNFEKKTGGDWEAATDQEKEVFKKRYLKEDQRRKKSEVKLKKFKRKKEERFQKQRDQKKKLLKKKKTRKIKEKNRKQKLAQKKKQMAKKKINQMKKKMQKLRKKK